ncbi:hypothetical protein GOBAR_AA35359 [Gossypium barbadense]|uniref:Trehalose-phosphatase n=1 Tax=Gossypium barbadense TaxID=3634 RepID=A0A2P5W2N7_GOSBA|nr:hypothetical protein GOBAR_AA35359 [Gossypium barbadense]
MNTKILDMRSLAQANRYVLLHSDKLSPYRQEFSETKRVVYGGIQISKRTEDKWLVENFSTWLAKQIPKMEVEQVDADVIALARGPHKYSRMICFLVPLHFVFSGILDDVRASSWLDAMKSSSPRHTSTRDYNNEIVSADTDVAYRTWMAKYPSALSSFEKITNFAKGKRISLFLDYDGTLSPIVDNPDFAFMSIDMRAAVAKAAKYFPTAIISRRSCDKVYDFVGLTDLYYGGSHGMDIMGPVRELSDNPPKCIRSTDKQGKGVFNSLVNSTKEIKGAKVENNKFCVSVHYRNVEEKVLEVRPVIDWDKGKALKFLLESLRLSNHDDVLPIYVGDDRTDEDAFKVLREGNLGYGILVSSAPKESIAVIDTSRDAFLHCYPNNGNCGCGLSECN